MSRVNCWSCSSVEITVPKHLISLLHTHSQTLQTHYSNQAQSPPSRHPFISRFLSAVRVSCVWDGWISPNVWVTFQHKIRIKKEMTFGIRLRLYLKRCMQSFKVHFHFVFVDTKAWPWLAVVSVMFFHWASGTKIQEQKHAKDLYIT